MLSYHYNTEHCFYFTMICIKCENSIDEERQRNRETNGNMHQKTHLMKS